MSYLVHVIIWCSKLTLRLIGGSLFWPCTQNGLDWHSPVCRWSLAPPPSVPDVIDSQSQQQHWAEPTDPWGLVVDMFWIYPGHVVVVKGGGVVIVFCRRHCLVVVIGSGCLFFMASCIATAGRQHQSEPEAERQHHVHLGRETKHDWDRDRQQWVCPLTHCLSVQLTL